MSFFIISCMSRVVAAAALRCLAVAILSLSLAAPALAQSASRTRLRTPPNSSQAGQTVKLIAEVDGIGGGAPTGTVSFSEGGVTLGAGTLSAYGAGQATLASSYGHACALTSAGGVVCWGDNRYGQLGDGTFVSRDVPAPVSGLSSDVVAVTAGVGHSCALTSAGAVKCWGWNDRSQLGDGSLINRSTPVDVTRLSSGVVTIASGGFHNCALSRTGAMKCWGLNNFGQLGVGTTAIHRTPVGVSGFRSGGVAVMAGYLHTCAVTSAGGVKCWGENTVGQLGDGAAWERHTPFALPELSKGVVAVTGGHGHSCALTAAHAVKCWGGNQFGDVGDGTTVNRYHPVDVAGLSSGVVAITNTCALKGNGAVLCWGGGQTTPVVVPDFKKGAVAIAAGGPLCAAFATGVVRCQGESSQGQLGDGTTKVPHGSVQVAGFKALIRARASMLTNSLAVGTHALQASFPGDASHTASSGSQSHVVVP
jgi:hypothetical protein